MNVLNVLVSRLGESIFEFAVSMARLLAVIMHHAERFLHGWPMAARQQSVRLDRCRSLVLRHVRG